MTATSWCLRCGSGERVQLHHPTGKANGTYLHPDLTVPLCSIPDGCHPLLHHLLQLDHLDGAQRPEVPGLVVGRIGELFRWLGWSSRPELVPIPRVLLDGCGRVLLDQAEALGALDSERVAS